MTPLIQTAEYSLVASYQYIQIVTGFVPSCVICKEICTEIWVSMSWLLLEVIKDGEFSCSILLIWKTVFFKAFF